MKNKKAKASIWIILILALCFSAVSSANAATLRLISLKCWETEDDGTDEVRLTVSGEGQYIRYRKDMRNGNIWTLDRRIIFTNRVTVRLYDLDDPDADDYLGGFVMRASSPTDGEQTLIFNRDDAHYELRYRIDP